jgi:hypothetical protein
MMVTDEDGMINVYYVHNGMLHPKLNEHGLPFRTKEEYPYSYDEFVVWQSRKDEAIDKMENIHTVWSDHLYRFANERGLDYNGACREVWGNERQDFFNRQPKDIEKFLRIYFQKDDIEILKISEGCNASNGYPYWKFIIQADYTKKDGE